MFERAIQIHEGLVATDRRNREYKAELAKFNDNLSHVLRQSGDLARAIKSNARALELLDELAHPSASLGIEQADAHNLGGRILQAQGSPSAAAEYHKSLDAFKNIEKGLDAGTLSEFHVRFWELLVNVASLRRERPNDETGRHVLEDALDFYLGSGRRAVASGSRSWAQLVLANLTALVPHLPDRERSALAAPLKNLQDVVDK